MPASPNQPAHTQALQTLGAAVNCVLTTSAQAHGAEREAPANTFTELAHVLAAELAQPTDAGFEQIPPTLTVKALNKLPIIDELRATLGVDKRSQLTTAPIIELTEPLNQEQQFAFAFFAGYLRATLTANEYSTLHNHFQNSRIFFNEITNTEPKLLRGLQIMKTMLPYFHNNFIHDWNCNYQFLDPEGVLKEAPIKTEGKPNNTMVCRHIVWPYFGKEKPEAYTSPEDMQNKVSPQTQLLGNLLADHEYLSLVGHAKLGQWLSDQAEALTGNNSWQAFLVATINHAMALHVRLKTCKGKKAYIVTFYDPNDTSSHIKLRKPTPESFTGLTFSDLIPSTRISAYGSNTIVSIFRAPKTELERAALLAKKDQPVIPKPLLSYDIGDLERNHDLIFSLLKNKWFCGLKIYRELFERAKNPKDNPRAPGVMYEMIKGHNILIEAWLDQEMAVIAQEKSEASLGTFHQHITNAQEVFAKLNSLLSIKQHFQFFGTVLEKLNTLDALANQEGWEPNALAALQTLKTKLQQKQNQLDAKMNATPATPWQRVLTMLSCGLVSANKPQTH